MTQTPGGREVLPDDHGSAAEVLRKTKKVFGASSRGGKQAKET